MTVRVNVSEESLQSEETMWRGANSETLQSTVTLQQTHSRALWLQKYLLEVERHGFSSSSHGTWGHKLLLTSGWNDTDSAF